MVIADCGSTWSKVLETEKNKLEIIPTIDLNKKKYPTFDIATGHSGKIRTKRFENELIALASGALALIPEKNFIIVDIGSRDVKYIKFKNRKIKKLDWNTACGSSTGATIEMLGKYFDINISLLKPSDTWINVTCGVFGMEKILELVSSGESPSTGVARFIHGLARNVYYFTGKPEAVYLSGGFCLSESFTGSLRNYCNVHLMGRTVLIKGLIELLRDEGIVFPESPV